MTISRYKKLFALSVLICAIPAQNAYGDSFASSIATRCKAKLIATGTAGLLSFAGTLTFLGGNVPEACSVSLMSMMMILISEKSKLVDYCGLTFDKNYRQKELITAISEKNLNKTEQIIKSGPDLNHVYNSWNWDSWSSSFTYGMSWTPLTWAIAKEDSKTVDVLLYHGADPNIMDEDGRLPLLMAAKNNDLPMVKTLLDHGANPNLINMDKAKISDNIKQFIDYHAYNYRPDYKKVIREVSQLNGISEDSELTIVSFLHGKMTARDEAQKRQAKQRDMRSPKNMTLLVEVGLE